MQKHGQKRNYVHNHININVLLYGIGLLQITVFDNVRCLHLRGTPQFSNLIWKGTKAHGAAASPPPLPPLAPPMLPSVKVIVGVCGKWCFCCGLNISFFAVVCPLSAVLHQRRSTGLCTVLRRASEANICQRSKKPATELAGTPGNQVQEAADVTNHVYGRQYKDIAG